MRCGLNTSLCQIVWVLDNFIVRWLALTVGLSLSGELPSPHIIIVTLVILPVSVLVRALWKPLRSERVQVNPTWMLCVSVSYFQDLRLLW